MLVLAFYILTFTVGFPANIFTFVTLCGKACRRVSASDILLLNLTAADLLLLLFLPFKMVEAAAGMTWPLPIVLCPVANFCFYSSIYLSSLFLTALSVERYLGVVFPLHYKDRKRPGRAMAASVVLWLLACSHCSIVFVAHYYGSRNQPVANRSAAISSVGPTVNGLKPDGSGPNALTITSPRGFNSISFSNPEAADGFIRSTSPLSNAADFTPHGSKTAASDVPTHNGSGISDPSDPKTSNPQIYTRPSAALQGTSGPTDSSRASNRPGSAPKDHSYVCYDDFTDAQLKFVLPLRLELFIVLFLLPFAVTIFCYTNFVRVLLSRPNIPLQKKQRAVGLAVATMVNFGVCFAPYNISHVVGFVEKKSPLWRVYALTLTSLNAALDPIIFYFCSMAVQRATAGVVVALQGKLRVVAGWCSSEASTTESDGSFT